MGLPGEQTTRLLSVLQLYNQKTFQAINLEATRQFLTAFQREAAVHWSLTLFASRLLNSICRRNLTAEKNIGITNGFL